MKVKNKFILPLFFLVFLLLPFQANSKLQLPADKAQRTDLLERIKRICRDYKITVAEQPPKSGKWLVKKGERKQLPTYEFVYDETSDSYKKTVVGEKPSDVTPKGCALICGLVDSSKTVVIEIKKTERQPSTGYTNRGNASNGTGSGGDVWWPDDKDTDATYIAYKNVAKDKIRSPLDIVLAHELIHALHGLGGTRGLTYADRENQTIDGSGGPNGHGVTENDIRNEQNRVANYRPPLEDRKGHCGEIKR